MVGICPAPLQNRRRPFEPQGFRLTINPAATLQMNCPPLSGTAKVAKFTAQEAPIDFGRAATNCGGVTAHWDCGRCDNPVGISPSFFFDGTV
jgi:hypothetical protein